MPGPLKAYAQHQIIPTDNRDPLPIRGTSQHGLDPLDKTLGQHGVTANAHQKGIFQHCWQQHGGGLGAVHRPLEPGGD